ncbi:unnamed protein product [Triticum turgidum subsp. durum]|uniref:histone acetyltransferase n=1 Tax=Triticum turgidum subsp. durum TaxID=4567 RepID=A0A9R0Y569_TRITD|nr:unnamed protein product [Triticum turgidum subsp. durum]
MLDPRSEIYPTIEYRPIQPSDLEVLEKIHLSLFPIRYEREFFLNVVNGNGVISWGAVDTSRSDEGRDELIGFVTTRMIAAKDSEFVSADSVDPHTNSHLQLLRLFESVISYNQPAINFYKKMLFKLVRRLPMFYYIRGQHYDSYLFVYYVNGGRTPCSPLLNSHIGLLPPSATFGVASREYIIRYILKFWVI